jgi:hypothetical protein
MRAINYLFKNKVATLSIGQPVASQFFVFLGLSAQTGGFTKLYLASLNVSFVLCPHEFEMLG